MLKADSILVSATETLSGFDSYELSFSAKTYGTTTGEFKKIAVMIYDVAASSTSTVFEAYPADNNFEAFRVDISAFKDKNIALIFQTLNAQGNKGAGIYNIITKGYSNDPIINQPPVAVATSSLSEAEVGDEIIFDGSASTSTNPYDIIDWLWDFGDGSTSTAPITHYSYLAPDVYEVYLRVGDSAGLYATSSPLLITIADRPEPLATSTATTTATTSEPFAPSDIVINEIYPAGTDEWLELYNNTSSTIDMSGWLLLDRYGSHFVTTTLSGTIPARGYFIISDVAGKLNNDADTLILYDNSGQIIDQAEYSGFSGKDDQSWARIIDGADTDSAGDFALTITPTEAGANVITAKASGSTGGSSYVAAKVVAAIATTTASTTAEIAVADYAGRILLNELLPNPVGSDEAAEFIELYNASTGTIDVAKLIIADASGNKHIIKTSDASSTAIASAGYLALYRDKTGIALNNSGVESVSLLAPDLSVIDSAEYAAEKNEGASFSRTADGRWRWVKSPTPNAINADDFLYGEDESGETVESTAKTAKLIGTVKKTAKAAVSKTYIDATLEQLKEYGNGDLVKVRGVVSVGPGILGSQYFYLAGSGVQVYCNKKDFPDLAIGDYVEVFGELALSSAGRRIKIADRSQIKFIGKQAAPQPYKITPAEVSEEYEGYLAEVSGTVLEISGKNLIIDSDGAEAKIYLNAKIDMKDLGAKAGDQLTAVGIVGKTASGYRLLPRDINDLKLTAGQVKGEYASAGQAPAAPRDYYLYALIGFLAVVCGWLWHRTKAAK